MEGAKMKKQLTALEMQSVLDKLEAYLVDLKSRWDQENTKRSWWRITRTYLVRSSIFLIDSVDELIQFVETIIPEGADKKTAVLSILSKMFDYIVVNAFPFWLRPAAPTIKAVVIDIIISHLIDFIVGKYNAGYWKKEKNEQENPEKTM